MDVSAEDVAAAWNKYITTTQNAAEAIAGTARFNASPDYVRRLYRNLMQVQAMAYNFAMVPRTDRPRIFTQTTYLPDFYTLGMACPDFHYVALFLDGSRRYRLWGNRGQVAWMSAQVQSHLLGDPRSRTVGDFDFADFDVAEDGSFDAVISGQPEPGHPIPLDPASSYNFVWLRRILGDWSDDAGEIHIELLEDEPEHVVEDTAAFLDRIECATDLTRFLLENWSIGLYDWFLQLAGGANRIAFLSGARLADSDVGSLAAYYASFVFELAEDEALIIEGAVPQGVYWGIQLGDVWSTSLDFIYRQSDINMRRIAVDSDGKYRVVIARKDPGVANWLDTDGNLEGVGTMRVFRSPVVPELPQMQVVKLSELFDHLPRETRRVTTSERSAALAHRERTIRALYAQ